MRISFIYRKKEEKTRCGGVGMTLYLPWAVPDATAAHAAYEAGALACCVHIHAHAHVGGGETATATA
jgi:hypothetical protein